MNAFRKLPQVRAEAAARVVEQIRTGHTPTGASRALRESDAHKGLAEARRRARLLARRSVAHAELAEARLAVRTWCAVLRALKQKTGPKCERCGNLLIAFEQRGTVCNACLDSALRESIYNDPSLPDGSLGKYVRPDIAAQFCNDINCTRAGAAPLITLNGETRCPRCGCLYARKES